MRLVVLMALLLAVLLSLPNALAIRSASVAGDTQVAVVATDLALLSLAPGSGDGNAAGTAAYQNAVNHNVLLLDFTKGRSAGTSYGFPPQASGYAHRFRYRELFTVTNRSDDALCIRVHVPGGGVSDLAGIYLRTPGDTGSGTQVAQGGGDGLSCATWLSTGGTFAVDFWWEINSVSEGLRSFNVRVEGSK